MSTSLVLNPGQMTLAELCAIWQGPVPLAIEWLAAAQGVDFLKPLATSPHLERTHAVLREPVPFCDCDRLFAPDIEAAKSLMLSGALSGSHQYMLASLWT